MTEYVKRNFKPKPKAAISTAIDKELVGTLDQMANADGRSRCAMAAILLESAIKAALGANQSAQQS